MPLTESVPFEVKSRAYLLGASVRVFMQDTLPNVHTDLIDIPYLATETSHSLTAINLESFFIYGSTREHSFSRLI